MGLLRRDLARPAQVGHVAPNIAPVLENATGNVGDAARLEPLTDEVYYSFEEVAALIPPRGVSVNTIRNWRRSGMLKAVRIGKTPFVTRSELIRFLSELRDGR